MCSQNIFFDGNRSWRSESGLTVDTSTVAGGKAKELVHWYGQCDVLKGDQETYLDIASTLCYEK